MVKPFIQLEHVHYHYPHMEVNVLKDISTSFHQNQFVAILGPNGSGKSTMAKVLNGLIMPNDGVVIVDQVNITDNHEQIWEIRHQVGMVFQNPDNQIVANTVEEDVAFGLENQGIAATIIRERVDKALSKMELSDYKLFEPHHLSGGQKQKVAIAGIIAMKPKVIIFDEATSMLDPKGREDVLKTAKQLSQDDGIAIIHITHFLQETLLADRVLVMNEGSILLDGKPEEVYAHRDLLKKVGLDVPIAVELAHRLKKHGYSFDTKNVSEEEFIKELWTFI